MAVDRRALLRFMTLYVALFTWASERASASGTRGASSRKAGKNGEANPNALAGRGLGPEELGFVLSAATALRLVCGPIGGRLADRLHAFRAELAVCVLDDRKMRQDLNTGGCGARARLRSSRARLWQGTRWMAMASQRSSG